MYIIYQWTWVFFTLYQGICMTFKSQDCCHVGWRDVIGETVQILQKKEQTLKIYKKNVLMKILRKLVCIWNREVSPSDGKIITKNWNIANIFYVNQFFLINNCSISQFKEMVYKYCCCHDKDQPCIALTKRPYMLD